MSEINTQKNNNCLKFIKGQFRKTEDFMHSVKKIFISYREYSNYIIIAIALAVLGTVLGLVAPGRFSQMSKLISDNFHNFNSHILYSLVKIAFVLAIIYLFSFVFSLTQNLIMSNVTQKILKSYRRDISIKINKLPLKYFDKNSIGDVLSRVTNDIDTMSSSLQQGVGMFFSFVTMLIGSTIMMFITNWIMAISGIFLTLFGFGISMLIVSYSQKYFKRQQDELGNMNSYIEESYTGHQMIKAYTAEKNSLVHFDKLNKILYNSSWKAQFLSKAMGPIMHLAGNLGYVAVCVTGALLASQKYIGFEIIVAFMVYIRLFSHPISHIAVLVASLQSAAAASERVFEFLKEEEVPPEDNKFSCLPNFKGTIEFDNVCFGYSGDKFIIKNFTAQIEPGQRVAIVGHTGSGKTTLTNLLMRFYEIQQGEIRIDGVSIRDLPRGYIRSLFSMVLQDAWVFNGSVMENIKYSNPKASREYIISVCKILGLHNFIISLANGYETILDENTNLSFGQRQLIAIARAMVDDSPMLIMDEATSSVDTRTEYIIQQAVNKLVAGKTCFVIAHRLSTIRDFDLILVMDHGNIVELGKHEELIKLGGVYESLYNSQFD